MNPLIRLKTIAPPLLMTLTLLCFWLLPTAKALLPAPSPDGGYPGGNTAEGINALHDVNTAVGINNTAVGANALTHDTTGQYNVAVGSGALASNTTGDFNMAIGTEALTNNNANFNLAIGFRVLFMNTTGKHLTGIGAAALRNNTTADFNTAIGADALRENTIGENNTAIGADALFSNTTGSANTATGEGALTSNTTGFQNTATGVEALISNTTGHTNTATGLWALNQNTTGNGNTANGVTALFNNTTGNENTANGIQVLYRNTTGDHNTANGIFALENNTEGNDNTADGASALGGNTTGSRNTATGLRALLNNSEGSDNIALGVDAGNSVTTADNVICIGASGQNVDNGCYIGQIFGVTSAGATAVYVNSIGKLGTVVSSQRFKDEIKPMDKASEAILALKPVTFRYKQEIDPARSPQFGLVAEDVEKVNPDLVVRDAEGKVNTVRYEAVNAMLLNEFIKEYRRFQEQDRKVEQQEAAIVRLKQDLGTQIAQQAKQIEALVATVKEQAAQIQNVSAELHASKPAPQVVNNP